METKARPAGWASWKQEVRQPGPVRRLSREEIASLEHRRRLESWQEHLRQVREAQRPDPQTGLLKRRV